MKVVATVMAVAVVGVVVLAMLTPADALDVKAVYKRYADQENMMKATDNYVPKVFDSTDKDLSSGPQAVNRINAKLERENLLNTANFVVRNSNNDNDEFVRHFVFNGNDDAIERDINNNNNNRKEDVDNPTGRIVGGQRVTPQQYPWVAALIRWDGEPTFNNSLDFANQFCGGSLIHPSFVLTAAHCFCTGNGVGYVPPLPFRVSLNRYDLDQNETTTREDWVTSTVHCHPQFNRQNLTNDVALIELGGVSAITPVPLIQSEAELDELIANNTETTVIGFGAIGTVAGHEIFDSVQRSVQVPLLSDAFCNETYTCLRVYYNTSVMQCAGDVADGGKDSCQGDSGGPQIIGSSAGNNETLIGAVSFGVGCGLQRIPGVYTRLAALLPFIDSVIDCNNTNCSSLGNNSVCDEQCNNAACTYDNGECVSSFCLPQCPPTWIGDGIFQLTCYEDINNSTSNSSVGTNNTCNDPDDVCPSSCLSDDSCDSACFTVPCDFDGDDCFCSANCSAAEADYDSSSSSGSGDVCRAECNSTACGLDNGNCCPGECAGLANNGMCNEECNIVGCDWDGSDCDCAANCSAGMIGNGVCDPACNVSACTDDGGDCDCAELCPPCFIGDGVCDNACNNAACNFDNGDCSSNNNNNTNGTGNSGNNGHNAAGALVPLLSTEILAVLIVSWGALMALLS